MEYDLKNFNTTVLRPATVCGFSPRQRLDVVVNIFVRDLNSQRAILIEAVLQNGAMGFVIGSIIYTEIIYLVPIAIYALLQYFVLLFYIGNIKLK